MHVPEVVVGVTVYVTICGVSNEWVKVLLILFEFTGINASPLTRVLFVVATQLKVLGRLAVNPKFKAVPEHTAPELTDVMVAFGFTFTSIVTV